MAEYVTEQKKILKKLLEENCDSAYTIEELIDKMRINADGHVPGKSTVYRLMTKLVAEGTVKRFVRGNSRKFAYQIVMGEHCDCHLHLKCMGCGRLIHLDESVSDELLDKVKSISDFSINEEATVLFGSCADCKKDKAGK
ncbi:MAG: transcriptional repressor [Clostridia bacterium]|nr:transcriptional repressor [Clostridia bacterium]